MIESPKSGLVRTRDNQILSFKIYLIFWSVFELNFFIFKFKISTWLIFMLVSITIGTDWIRGRAEGLTCLRPASLCHGMTPVGLRLDMGLYFFSGMCLNMPQLAWPHDMKFEFIGETKYNDWFWSRHMSHESLFMHKLVYPYLIYKDPNWPMGSYQILSFWAVTESADLDLSCDS